MNHGILLEIQYLPPVQYFTKLLAFDEVWIEQHEHYQKGSYRNRCHIAGPNKVQRLSVPLERGKNQRLPVREVRIAYAEPWQLKHWHSIRTAYGSSPYFVHFSDEIRPFYEEPYELLFDFNLALLRTLLRLMNLPVTIRFTEDFQETSPPGILDFRNSIFPKNNRQKEDPAFQPAPYAQVFTEKHGFLPNLSILDLLFCTGPQAVIHLQASIVE